MSRTEFSKPVRRAALDRAAGKYECCGFPIVGKVIRFDHVIPDALLGPAKLSNCMVMCVHCHDEKTHKHDVPTIAKAVRISDKHHGIRSARQKIQSAGFRKSEPQHTATRPIERIR